MKIFTLLLFYLSFYSFSQDSIYIQVFPDEKYSLGTPIYSANGYYKIVKETPLKVDKTPYGFYFIDPVSLEGSDNTLFVSSLSDSISKLHIRMINPLNHRERYNALYEEYQFYARRKEQLQFLKTNKMFYDSIELWHYNAMGTNRKSDLPAFFDMSFFITDTLSSYSSYEKVCASQIRPANQEKLNNWLRPFYISQTEISNREYRLFVNWVRDSIAINLLYDSLGFDNAKELLNVSKHDQKKLTENKKEEYLKIYGLNYDYFNEVNRDGYSDLENIPVLANMYYPQPERYYKRREFNVSKFIYLSENGELISIYPDTNCWSKDTLNYDYAAYENMYFWHPAYDNYPVVGLNVKQMKAFLEWYQNNLNKANTDTSIYYEVGIPSIYQYEMALKQCLNISMRNSVLVHPQQALTYYRNEDDAHWHINKVYASPQPKSINMPFEFKFHNWLHNNSTSPIYQLLGNVAEVCSNDLSDSTMTILGGDRYLGLFDSNENQFNTLFYQREFQATKGYSTVGFRPVVYIRKR